MTVFPGENYQAPRSWTERAYHKLIYFNKVDQGGHYAASAIVRTGEIVASISAF